MYSVETFFNKFKNFLSLEICAGEDALSLRRVALPEAEIPGLALTGYLNGHNPKRFLILGKSEIAYLSELSTIFFEERISSLQTHETPALFIADGEIPPHPLLSICQKEKIPLFATAMKTPTLYYSLLRILREEFAPSMSFSGTMVEVFGIGILLQGESSVGKSETALGLIKRGHRLISDDVVKIKIREEGLECYGFETSRFHMEIRGIGIINVANLYGRASILEKKNLDIVVKLEVWDDRNFYDRAGLDEKTVDMLGIDVPYYLLPVKPCRDVVLLIETIALNHSLKKMGCHSAKEFDDMLVARTSSTCMQFRQESTK